jgi:hypothetical protein
MTRGRPARAALVLVLGWATASAALGPPPASGISVAITAEGPVDTVSIDARQVPVGAVLSELGRRAGFEVQGIVASQRPVSVELRRLPLDQALKRLLEGKSFVLIYGEHAKRGTARLERLVLLGDDDGIGLASRADGWGPEASIEEADASAYDSEARGFNAEASAEALLHLASSENPRSRAAALEALASHATEDWRARQALLDHVSDPELEVRSVVIGVLGAFVDEWPGVEEAMMQAVVDPAVTVRHLALQTLSALATPRAGEAVRLALDDADPMMRAFARTLLRGPAEHGSPVESSTDSK